MKKIKVLTDLPITPTSTPKPGEIVTVSLAVIELAQRCLLSPSALMGALQAAADMYATNAVNKGFDPAIAQEARELGSRLAAAVAKPAPAELAAAETPAPDAQVETGILTTDGRRAVVNSSILSKVKGLFYKAEAGSGEG